MYVAGQDGCGHGEANQVELVGSEHSTSESLFAADPTGTPHTRIRGQATVSTLTNIEGAGHEHGLLLSMHACAHG